MELDPDDPLLKGLAKANVPPSISDVIILTDTQIAISTALPQDPDILPTKHHPGGHPTSDVTPDKDTVRGRPGDHTTMAIIDANDLIGRSYLQEPEEDGTRHRLRIIAKLDERDADIANDPTMI